MDWSPNRERWPKHRLDARAGRTGRLDVSFPLEAVSVRRARYALHEQLVGDVADAVCEAAELLVSELVGNSVKHSGTGPRGSVRLQSQLSPTRLRIEVSDGGHAHALTVSRPEFLAESGYGLFLVDRVASRWGYSTSAGTLVWFEIDLDVREATASEVG
jgi:anti-sigma regulatory factor (Ser/Thr protein kinase)